MSDVHSPAQRAFNMSRIGGKHTKPELVLRRALHKAGFRYRLHAGDLPARPDMVFPAWRAVIFVHGCFWHGHECRMFHWPKTRATFWRTKIHHNRERDARALELLRAAGWRTLIVWECALRGPARLPVETVSEACARFLRGDAGQRIITGRRTSRLAAQ